MVFFTSENRLLPDVELGDEIRLAPHMLFRIFSKRIVTPIQLRR